MDLTCYLHSTWAPYIRPAPATRPWMDATPEAFAYRCLPLNIANAHGWELLNPHGFEATWNGEGGLDAVTVRPDPGAAPTTHLPLSLFGQGVLTFQVEGLFRTPPGWNLWIGGSPNRFKDAIYPLTGVVETDWSPFSFTMNWRFTRPHSLVRFEAMEPFGFFFPIQRATISEFEPRFAPLETNAELRAHFAAWSQSRVDFHKRMAQGGGVAPSERWQKHYYLGQGPDGKALADDHAAKLRLPAFDARSTPQVPTTPREDRGLLARAPLPAEPDRAKLEAALARRERLLETLERLRERSPALVSIHRRAELSSEEFLDSYYALNRPVILLGELENCSGWLADLDAAGAVRPSQIGPLLRLLNDLDQQHEIKIGPAGAFSRLQQSSGNRLIAQAKGRRQIALIPPSETGRLYETGDGFSAIADLENLAADARSFPRLAGMRVYGVELTQGEVLFVPFGWWLQVRALEDDVSISFTKMRWDGESPAGSPAL